MFMPILLSNISDPLKLRRQVLCSLCAGNIQYRGTLSFTSTKSQWMCNALWISTSILICSRLLSEYELLWAFLFLGAFYNICTSLCHFGFAPRWSSISCPGMLYRLYLVQNLHNSRNFYGKAADSHHSKRDFFRLHRFCEIWSGRLSAMTILS